MAVKTLVRTVGAARQPDPEAIRHEITIPYNFMQSISPSCPQLVYLEPNGRAFRVVAVGKPINQRVITDQQTLRKLLLDVLTCVAWLHDNGILHRDIRSSQLNAVSRIIDFGVATTPPPPLPGQTEYPEQEYRAGYICCPRELICQIRKHYIPRRAQELDAWVLLLSWCGFPNGVAYLQSYLVGKSTIDGKNLAAH